MTTSLLVCDDEILSDARMPFSFILAFGWMGLVGLADLDEKREEEEARNRRRRNPCRKPSVEHLSESKIYFVSSFCQNCECR